MKKIRLGAATGWSRDRFEPAGELVRRGNIDYLCFDSMSEVTMSAAQVQRFEDAGAVPYDPYLVARMEPILAECKRRGIRIVTNQGWLDPVAAAERVLQIAREQAIPGLKVAAVTGGVFGEKIADMGLMFLEDGQPVADSRDRVVSGEVYLGAGGIIEALRGGADVVITSRVADACVYLGPIAHEFGWDLDDHHKAAKGMIIGHLLECGCQVSGGYFCDPGYKDVPDLHNVGNPIVEIGEDGRVFIEKVPGSGGLVSVATCKEQLLYEVQDPANYLCPDVIADLTRVTFRQAGENRVQVFADEAGKPRTATLKALIGVTEGFMAEEMVLFAGPGALARAEATKRILEERFRICRLEADEVRFDFIGHSSVHRESSPAWQAEPYEVVLRVAIKTRSRKEAEKLRKEVDPLAVNGLSGTGKWGTSAPGSRVRAVVGLNSALVPRERVPHEVIIGATDEPQARAREAQSHSVR